MERFDAALAGVGLDTIKIPVPGKRGKVAAVASVFMRPIEGREWLFTSIAMIASAASTGTSGLGAFYGLTQAEMTVLDLLGGVNQPAAIAEELGLSIHTVRTHIRNIYGKTSVNSDLELLRLTLSFEE